MDGNLRIEVAVEPEPSAIAFALALVGVGANALLDGIEAMRAETGDDGPDDETEEALSSLTSRSWCAAALGVRWCGDLPAVGAEGFAPEVVERLRRAARWHAWTIGPDAPRPDDAPWSTPAGERAWRWWAGCPMCAGDDVGPDPAGPVTVGELLLGVGAVMAELRLREWRARLSGAEAARLSGGRDGAPTLEALGVLGRPLLGRAVRCGVQARAGVWPVGDDGQAVDVRRELRVLAAGDLPRAWRRWLCAAAATWQDWPWSPSPEGCSLLECTRHAAAE